MHKCCIFSIVPEIGMGMPGIKTEFEFDILVCFGTSLALYDGFFFFFFFHSDLPSTHCATC